MAYAPQTGEPELIAVPVVVDHVQRRLLNAGRLLLAAGWLVLTYTISSSRTANAEHALIGLALLLLGVFVVMVSLVANHNQFPGVARAAAAIADAVLFYFLAPAN